jgi:hypothetical protein
MPPFAVVLADFLHLHDFFSGTATASLDLTAE